MWGVFNKAVAYWKGQSFLFKWNWISVLLLFVTLGKLPRLFESQCSHLSVLQCFRKKGQYDTYKYFIITDWVNEMKTTSIYQESMKMYYFEI